MPTRKRSPTPVNLLADIANGRPVGLPGDAAPCDWHEFAGRAEEAMGRGAMLTHSLHRRTAQAYWVYWPHGVPQARTFALLSSRIGRDLSRWQAWFDALRSAIRQADPLQEIIIAVAGTTTSRYVQRGAKLFDFPILTVVRSQRRITSVASWLSELLAQPAEYVEGHTAYVSPFARSEAPGDDLPIQDVLLADAAERIVVLHARAGGTVDRLIRRALNDPAREPNSVQICMAERLIRPRLRQAYLAEGAVAWHPPPTEGPTPSADEPDDAASHEISAIELSRFNEITKALAWSGESILSHCTRKWHGPWPDESHDEYLDRLILHGPTDDRSAYGVLSRMVRQRRIMAASGMYRGGYRAVSFSQVPLPQLLAMRTFRNHRAAWDFEPYGICVTQSALQGLGARPVYYGGEELWNLLSELDRPFFQKRYSDGADGNRTDWSVEREWRVVGDVPLAALPTNHVWLFVPTWSEARYLARHSPWTIVVVED